MERNRIGRNVTAVIAVLGLGFSLAPVLPIAADAKDGGSVTQGGGGNGGGSGGGVAQGGGSGNGGGSGSGTGGVYGAGGGAGGYVDVIIPSPAASYSWPASVFRCPQGCRRARSSTSVYAGDVRTQLYRSTPPALKRMQRPE